MTTGDKGASKSNKDVIQALESVLYYFKEVEAGREINLDFADLAWATLRETMDEADRAFGWARK